MWGLVWVEIIHLSEGEKRSRRQRDGTVGPESSVFYKCLLNCEEKQRVKGPFGREQKIVFIGLRSHAVPSAWSASLFLH